MENYDNCSYCGDSISLQEFNYSMNYFNGKKLCRICQNIYKTENRIKGNIAETIVSGIFDAMRFYIIKFGKEHISPALTQLQPFVTHCDGKFKYKKGDGEFITPNEVISRLPDFAIVDKGGNVNIVEVKFKADGDIRNSDRVFDIYPEVYLIVVNLSCSKESLGIEDLTEEQLKELQSTHFHVWFEENGTPIPKVGTFKKWLKDTHHLEGEFYDKSMNEFEKLIERQFKK